MNSTCRNYGKRYYAGQVWLYSLPGSTYGLDVLAWIGWQHEYEHRQLVEIQRGLNQRGILVNERNVGKLYRQFLLSASSENVLEDLKKTVDEYGGPIRKRDALQPEGPSGLLYVLYEVQSGKPVAALQQEHCNQNDLESWLRPYQRLPLPVLATLSDGESTLVAALKPAGQMCPISAARPIPLTTGKRNVLDYENMRQDLGGLPKVPMEQRPEALIPPFRWAYPTRDTQSPSHQERLPCARPFEHAVNRAQSQTVDLGWLEKGTNRQAIAEESIIPVGSRPDPDAA